MFSSGLHTVFPLLIRPVFHSFHLARRLTCHTYADPHLGENHQEQAGTPITSADAVYHHWHVGAELVRRSSLHSITSNTSTTTNGFRFLRHRLSSHGRSLPPIHRPLTAGVQVVTFSALFCGNRAASDRGDHLDQTVIPFVACCYRRLAKNLESLVVLTYTRALSMTRLSSSLVPKYPMVVSRRVLMALHAHHSQTGLPKSCAVLMSTIYDNLSICLSHALLLMDTLLQKTESHSTMSVVRSSLFHTDWISLWHILGFSLSYKYSGNLVVRFDQYYYILFYYCL